MLLKNKKNLKIVGIIHARGGSKRIPLKNIKLLAGKPLIAYMIESALKSKRLNRVVVSTDHDEIARIGKEYGAEVPFKRPAELAEDVPSELVSKHAIDYLIKNKNYYPDIAVTMQPTTPFCRPEDIDACIDKLIETNADSVMTIKEIRERPEWMYKLIDDRAVSLTDKLFQGEIGVSQNLPKLYIPNGGIYATKVDVLMEQNLIIGRDTRGIIMPLERSIDIDEQIDFKLAEIMAKELGYVP
jgi:CMP-N-acetylneuraminic acid synthetase